MNYGEATSHSVAGAVGFALVTLLLALPVAAQPGAGGPPPGAPRSARDAAPIDLTGQWVSIVTEDWRFRMVTPKKNDFPGLPLTPAAQAIAAAWDPAKDEAEGNACKAYGAAAIMRVPGRIRIAWDGGSTLVIETDAGRQTRELHFGDVPEQQGERTWQGLSRAEWIPHTAGRGQAPANGSLQVVTTGMKAGYLRKNGVPYSEDAVVTEYFDILEHPDGSTWLVVKTIVEDPTYLSGPYVVSSNFRKESSRGGWNPQPCSAD